MTRLPDGRHTVTPEQLCIGLHVRLGSWLGHPFLLSSFKIKNQGQIDALRAMGLKEFEYLPKKSDCTPLEAELPAAEAPSQVAPAIVLYELMQEKKERIETLSAERERIRLAEKKYVKTANAVKNVIHLANHHPKRAAEQSQEIAADLVEIFIAEQNPYIHLMGENLTDESAYFHSLNVTVLALILARAMGITDPELLGDIARGAVLHDVGKALIPGQVLNKREDLNPVESKLFEMHPGYGIKLMQEVDSLSRRVREIILFHHELLDGSGYPKGISGDGLDLAVRIVTIADAYDTLCNQRVPARSRTPSEALSYMYKTGQEKYDKAALAAFVKSLGIYPPGTIVALKSGRIGIVMSVNVADLLHPDLMLYDPAIPKEEAAVVNLKRDLEDSVERTLRPGALPQPVHDYLSPRKRICYFVDHSTR